MGSKNASEEALKSKSKTVHLVNPRDSSGTCHVGIKDIGQPVDVVDLCINPVAGRVQQNMFTQGLPLKGIPKAVA